MKCPKCGNVTYDERSVYCNNCGEKLERDKIDKKGIPVSVFILACVCIILLMSSLFLISSLFKKGSETSGNNNDTTANGTTTSLTSSTKSSGTNVNKTDKTNKTEFTDQINIAENGTNEATDKDITSLIIDIVQVDNVDFPLIKYYTNISDENQNVVKGLGKDNFRMYEIYDDGSQNEVQIEEIYQILHSDDVFINLVIDKSDSMSEYNKMNEAKTAAKWFLNEIGSQSSNYVEITGFDSYVYLNQSFTNDFNALYDAIDNIYPSKRTALYDAICAALNSTYLQKGAKCVIAFTDGMENESSYTYDDVVRICNATGIPVYIIGIGEEWEYYNLSNLARECNGKFISAKTQNLSEILASIYYDIYLMQREMYLVTFISPNNNNGNISRTIKLLADENQGYTGVASRKYIPVPMDNIFSNHYSKKDFMIEKSSSEYVTESDLMDLSLAELRIARNEIFARHGRQFWDPLLNKWFYSKQWYLNIPIKYSPSEFDNMNSPLSKLEIQNAETILAYEKEVMNSSQIFPKISYEILTEYDVALDKLVLARSLEEFYSRNGLSYGQKSSLNEVEKKNIEFIENAINRSDIIYNN